MASEKLSVILELIASQYKREAKAAADSTAKLNDTLGKTGKHVDTLGANLTKTAGLMSSVGSKMTAGITLPLIGMASGAVKAASDLGESMNAIGVVFGEATGKVAAFGETAADSAGLSQRAFNEAVIPIGQLLNNFGFEADESAKAVIALTQRAADLGSVLNVDTAVALDKFQKGLAGESEPLKAFGVDVSVAALQTEALALGLIRAGEPLDKAAKAQAAMSIIMRETNFATGDFANTLETSLPNQLKALKADAENVAASLGKAMLPAMLDVVKVLKDMASGFADMSVEQQNFIVKAGLAAAAMGPLLYGGGKLVKMFKVLRDAALGLNIILGLGGGGGLIAGIKFLVSALGSTWVARLGGAAAGAAAHYEVLNFALEENHQKTEAQTKAVEALYAAQLKQVDKPETATPKPPSPEVHDSWNQFGDDIVEIHDSWQTGIANVQAGLAAELPVMSEAHLAAIKLAESNRAAARTFRVDLTNEINKFNTFFSGAVDEIELTLTEMETNWSETQTQNERFFNGLAVLAQAGLDDLVAMFREQGPAAAGAVEDLTANMDRAFAWERRIEEGQRQAAALANSIANGLAGETDTVGAAFKAFGISLADQLEAGFSTADLGNTLTQLMDLAAGGGQGVTTPGGPWRQEFATGGVVQGPLGSPQLVLAHGGETILPTHTGPVGGSTTIVVQSPMGDFRSDLQYATILASVTNLVEGF